MRRRSLQEHQKKRVKKAMKLVKIKYEVLEPVLDFRKAKDNPVLVHPEDNWKSLCPGRGR